jgi:hypothetical protein
MHTVSFKTFANTGEAQPQELKVEYIPESDMLIFSIAGKEIFNTNYNDNFESILRAIDAIQTIPNF